MRERVSRSASLQVSEAAQKGQPTSFEVLRGHFFRRFFDNDTLALEGDTLTTVVRALSFVAAPGLLVAFWLQPEYASIDLPRPYWMTVGDHYFFVMIAMVTMGLVAVFEWEMLFADRLDFLVLSPLPVKERTMLLAKAAALGQMLALFLVSTVVFGTVLFPAISRRGIIHHGLAHAWATLLAGAFAAVLVLAVGGVLLCVLDAGTFRRVSVMVQIGMVSVLTLVVCLYPAVAHSMQRVVERPEWTRWLPPFWFLGIYERMLDGSATPAWAYPLSTTGLRALWVVAAVAAVTYPLAWARKRRMTIENTAGRGLRRMGPVASLLFRLGARTAEERAVFGFVGQTLARNQRYQVYLAMYAGAGLGLAAALLVTFHTVGGRVRLGLSKEWLHGVMPMLLFWLVMGMRMAFAFPIDLRAAWVFATSGVEMERCVAAARRWVLLCGWMAVAVIAVGLYAAGFRGWASAVQVVFGASLVLVLADAFFAFRRGVPFTRARMPGKSSLPLMLAMYLGVFPALVTMMAGSSMWIEMTHRRLWVLPVIALGVHWFCREKLRRSAYQDAEDEMEGTLTLGLTQ